MNRFFKLESYNPCLTFPKPYGWAEDEVLGNGSVASEPRTGPVSVEIMISIELTMEGSHF